MLKTGLDAVTIIIIQNFLLALYSLALMMNAKDKTLKIIHLIFTAFWVVQGILNMV